MSAILIVDDHVTVCAVIKEVLSDEGHDCTVSYAGADALAKLEVGRFDLVILDHNMPKMTGTDVLLALRADPRNAKLPVLICTSDSLYQRKAEEGTAAGDPDACVSKPLDMKRLVEAVAKLARPSKGA